MESNKSSSHGDVSTSPSFLNNHHQFNNGGDIIPKKKKNRIMHVGSYEVGKTLGNGTFGKVKLGTNICTKENVAIKFIKNNKLSGKQKETCFREIDIMKLLDHPNIVKLLDVVDKREEEGTTYLIVEYVSGGELFDYIVAREYIKEKEARKFFRQMISAIEYCHANLIVHRDLKPENLLLDSNGDIKISDFGLSNNIQPGKLLESFCGSPLYAAPEILKAEKYLGPPVDIWSLGVIMYAVLCGNLPWEGDSQAEISFNSVHGNYEDPTHLSAEAVHILRRMIVPNPKDRATIQELKNHPWTNIDYQEIPKSHLPPRDAVHEIKEDIFAHLISLGFPNTKETRDIILKNENCGIVNVYHLLLDRYASKEVENLKSKLELLSKRKKSFSDKRNPSTNSLASIPEDSNDLSSNNNNNQQQQNSPPSKTNSSSTSSSNRESNNNSPSQGSIKEISLDELDNHIEQLDNDIENSDNNKSSSLTRRSSDPNKDIENSLKAQGLFSSYSAPGVPNSDHNYDFETYQQQQQYQQQLHQQQLQLQQQYQSQIQSDISFPHDDVEIESYSIQQQQLQQQQQQQQEQHKEDNNKPNTNLRRNSIAVSTFMEDEPNEMPINNLYKMNEQIQQQPIIGGSGNVMRSQFNQTLPTIDQQPVIEAPKTRRMSLDSRMLNGDQQSLVEKNQHMASPRTSKGIFKSSTTTTKSPEKTIIELKRSLEESGLFTKKKGPYLFLCFDEDNSVKFQIEIVKICNLDLTGIQLKRLSGDTWKYKDICTELVESMKL
ncbi:hypothetical protein DDB_G0281895 [Dictyostelium discoideum AX4]|uniref:Probable serine/threonine-protein kinase MARK-C n=1 Tax=Dictyostelium discoideum TaxID=44689 RepID=MRKC_DICDI|nr:hypothetical protein DDB_G0281895 [Dictyostelium discoideum AX4]Q54TA3.1 RecName: Full=Probable serine/threonine-protein kinase MARK-C [Dictyostelium discoideum]EAL66507.1 hypothetical protein DDB_G0281895 [Dictyostelium discoideum AX4]|eukprot:XP_640486.1 hypothetical protein DDB_G0281895 [Dictyostelium discoideum AX4]